MSARTDLGAVPSVPAAAVALLDHALGCVSCQATVFGELGAVLCREGFRLLAHGEAALRARERGRVTAVLVLARGGAPLVLVVEGRRFAGADGLPADAGHGGTPAARPGVEFLEARGIDGAVVDLDAAEQDRARDALEEEGT